MRPLAQKKKTSGEGTVLLLLVKRRDLLRLAKLKRRVFLFGTREGKESKGDVR